jgi:hypothetical protein
MWRGWVRRKRENFGCSGIDAIVKGSAALLKRQATILFIAGLAAGCGARVPANFSPPPPRLAAAEAAIADHTGNDEIVVLVFGDAGTGSDDQHEIGRRMAEVCGATGCDLALMLGDNFYWRGVDPPRGGRWDSAFAEKFEEPYAGLGRLDMWAVAGNHDWYKGRASIDTQIAYTQRSERWRMLAYDYAVPGLPAWLHIYGLDTVIIDTGGDIGQIARAEAALCGTSGWKLVFGHHPIYTSGGHADSNGAVPSMEERLLPLVEDCGIDLLLSGHDHHQEHLAADGFHQIIQGTGGKVRPVEQRPARHEASQRFAASKYGFAILRIRPDAIEATFYGYERGAPEEFGVIYETTITARSETGGPPG